MSDTPHPASQYKEPYPKDDREPIRPAFDGEEYGEFAPACDHNFTHGKEKCGPYNKFTMILIYCTKCGEVRFREMV